MQKLFVKYNSTPWLLMRYFRGSLLRSRDVFYMMYLRECFEFKDKRNCDIENHDPLEKQHD